MLAAGRWGDCDAPYWGGLGWTAWRPLDAPRRSLPSCGGLYRIRAVGVPGLVYVGQTGRDLRERVAALARNAYRDEDDPPWNDPHTAAPVLWAFRLEQGMSFEVSVAALDVDKAERQCVEDFLLYGHRLQRGMTTLANLGRGHPWWARPSNKSKGQGAVRREEAVEYPSLPVAVGEAEPAAASWLGLAWTPFEVLSATSPPEAPGVYRIKKDEEVVYLGESKQLGARIRAHSGAQRFAGCLASFHCIPEAMDHHLLEREVDLIGAFYAVRRRAPLHQYRPTSR